jgi:hypothetical protein
MTLRVHQGQRVERLAPAPPPGDHEGGAGEGSARDSFFVAADGFDMFVR